MRPINRIDPFTKRLAEIWAEEFPDWRFGQLISNFFGWVVSVKGIDIFFPEEEEMIKLLEEFAGIEKK